MLPRREGVELPRLEVVGVPVRSVEVQRTSVSTPVLVKEIENLPLNQSNVMNLAASSPGIRAYAPDRGRSLPSAGAVPEILLINLQLDGVEMKDVWSTTLVGVPQTACRCPPRRCRSSASPPKGAAKVALAGDPDSP